MLTINPGCSLHQTPPEAKVDKTLGDGRENLQVEMVEAPWQLPLQLLLNSCQGIAKSSPSTLVAFYIKIHPKQTETRLSEKGENLQLEMVEGCDVPYEAVKTAS